MQKKITFRLDDELRDLLNKVPNLGLYNLSVLTREALKLKLSNFLRMDNNESTNSQRKENNHLNTNKIF